MSVVPNRFASANAGIPPQPTGEGEPKPTPAELKQAFSGHISQRNGPDAPLMTKAMREREEAKLGIKKKEYHEVCRDPNDWLEWESHSTSGALLTTLLFSVGQIRVRVRFADRTALEGLFPASTLVPVLYDFVRAHLAPAYSKIPFVIYQSPPRRDLPERGDPKLRGQTIKDLGMAPQAIVNIRWNDAAMNGNTFPAPLSLETLSQAKDLPIPPSFDSVPPSSGQTIGDNGKQGAGVGDAAKKVRREAVAFMFSLLTLRSSSEAAKVAEGASK
jgi:tether containing UBX domain for GLUT4